MHGAVLAAVFGAALSSAVAAQQAPSQQVPARSPAFGGVLVDRVVATVNDSAILESNLRAVASGFISTHIRENGGITPADRQMYLGNALERLIGDYRLAKAAASLGPLGPDQIEQIVQSELDRARIAQEREMGVNEMSREYKRTNRTLAAVQSEQRIDWQKRLAEDMTVNRRLARQANLYVTPRMLRESYDKLRGDLFVRKATARVVLLRFDGQDAQQRAAEAAELWRKDALETGQLVERFPSAMLLPETEANDLGSGLATIKQFALAGPEGTVSEPVKSGAYFYVARVSKHRTERNGRFEDPDVQRELQQLCANSVYREFRHEAMDRAKQRTEVWRR